MYSLEDHIASFKTSKMAKKNTRPLKQVIASYKRLVSYWEWWIDQGYNDDDIAEEWRFCKEQLKHYKKMERSNEPQSRG